MKKRNIPFGYMWENGRITICPFESETVQHIFYTYLAENSLLKIAESLNQQGVQYLPGVTNWNKSRLARIIAEERYIGSDTYPKIIEQNIFAQANQLKSAQNNQRNIDRQSGIYQLDIPFICQKCGAKMVRISDVRIKSHEKWVCQNSKCHETVFISDNDLMSQMNKSLNQVIAQPTLIQELNPQEYKLSAQILKAEREINHEIALGRTDKESLIARMESLAALKYSEIDSTPYIARKMKADFAMQSPLSDFSPEFANKVIREVRLETQNLCLILVNNQEIGKELTA